MKRAAITAGILTLAALLASASGMDEETAATDDGFGIQAVEIRSGPVDVVVSPGDPAGAVLDSDVTSAFPWDDAFRGRLRQEREGSRLYAWMENEGPLSFGVHGPIRVRVPRGATLVVRTTSGSVTAEGLEGGKVDVRTTSGSVNLRHVRGRILVDSVSGSVSIESGDGIVDARTVSGKILGRGLRLSEYCEFTSVSGSIDVGLLSDLESLGFDLRSVSGSIRLGTIRTEHGLRMGFGRTLVRARTISGSLSFR